MPGSRQPYVHALLTVLLGSVAACDDEPDKLVEEEGTWSMIEHDVTGSGSLLDVDASVRKDTLLLRYWSKQKVVQTAICAEEADDTPGESRCMTSSAAAWHCRCFAYAYEGDTQRWVEFTAGDPPPPVSLEGSDNSDDSGTGGGEGGSPLTVLSPVADTTGAYMFQTLPAGVFGSNGVDSRFVFLKKATSVFSPVLEGEERETCTPCVE